jgi:effector-associated domain 1 (EAD1)-containing protein
MLITLPPTVDFETANGKQLRLIRIAFLAVFIRRSKLSIFMSDQFGKNFDQMAEGDDFEDQVFNLLRDARAEGWLGELVTKAVAVYAQATAFKNMIDQWFLFADAPAGI